MPPRNFCHPDRRTSLTQVKFKKTTTHTPLEKKTQKVYIWHEINKPFHELFLGRHPPVSLYAIKHDCDSGVRDLNDKCLSVKELKVVNVGILYRDRERTVK